MSSLINIPIPDIPKGVNPEQEKFYSAVKELLENFNGVRGSGVLNLVTENLDLSNATVASPFTDSTTIPPPTGFAVVAGTFNHTLSWTNTTSDKLAGVEVWAHTENSVTEATRIAIVGKGGTTFLRQNFNVTLDYYYWVRSISFYGKYSTWCPTPAMGGYLVERKESLGETIDGVIDALLGATPDLYSADTEYEEDDPVRWVGADGGTRRYKRLDYDLGTKGIAPSNALYWERTGILVQGEIDGEATVGIDGNLVVDQTIMARSIITSELTVGDGSAGSIVMNDGCITVAKLHEDAQTAVLNSNQEWGDVSGDGKPADDATQNVIYYQSGTPSSPIDGAIWIDIGTDPPVEKLYTGGAWVVSATNDSIFRHSTDTTKIDGGKIFTGSILADSIGANQITANKLSVSTLSAITANMGTLTAGKIQSTDGKFIIQLGASGYISIKDAAGVERVRLGYIP